LILVSQHPSKVTDRTVVRFSFVIASFLIFPVSARIFRQSRLFPWEFECLSISPFLLFSNFSRFSFLLVGYFKDVSNALFALVRGWCLCSSEPRRVPCVNLLSPSCHSSSGFPSPTTFGEPAAISVFFTLSQGPVRFVLLADLNLMVDPIHPPNFLFFVFPPSSRYQYGLVRFKPRTLSGSFSGWVAFPLL